MGRFIVAIALALCINGACIHAARAEEVVPLVVGEAEVRIAVPEGYLRLSEKAPTLYAASAAAMPPPIRLVEALMTRADLKRSIAGLNAIEPYLQVQVVRDAEALDFSAEDWEQLQPTLARQLGATDLDAATRAMQAGMGKRIGQAMDSSVDIQYGEVGKPQVYSQAGGVVRYAIRVPMNASVNGVQVRLVLDCAGAAMVINGKLVMLNVYLNEDREHDSAAQARAFLATLVERAQALNDIQGAG